MHSFVLALTSLIVLGGGAEKPEARAGVDICLFMRGAAAVPAASVLKPVQEAVAAGDLTGALVVFRETAVRLEAEAQRLFFDGGEGRSAQEPAPRDDRGDGPGLVTASLEPRDAARAFLDEHVYAKTGMLAIRGDRFSLRSDVASFGAWLSCRCGDLAFGIALLKGGWRDFADSGFRTDAAFLMAAFGQDADARTYLPEGVDGERETLARGLLACRSGNADEGKTLLNKALETLKDLQVRGAARQMLEGCGK
ncbi:MAG: hypothetical protein FJ109_13580 [Deltaproteobacteria bacterium]|nr:hypothetical protein [Deltaproteobacteria bacterium]